MENRKVRLTKREEARRRKALRKPFVKQFFYKNHMNFLLSLFGAVNMVVVNLLISWLIQQISDIAAGTAADSA